MTVPKVPTLPGEYGRVIAALGRHDVEFVVCGGVACMLHGSSRATYDVDLYVRLETANLRRFVDAVKSLRLQPRVPEPLESLIDEQKRRQWIENKNALVYTLVSNESSLQLDVFLQYPIPFDDLQQQANSVRIEGKSFKISSKQHLIQAKREVQPLRTEDEYDIKFLQEQISRETRRSQSE